MRVLFVFTFPYVSIINHFLKNDMVPKRLSDDRLLSGSSDQTELCGLSTELAKLLSTLYSRATLFFFQKNNAPRREGRENTSQKNSRDCEGDRISKSTQRSSNYIYIQQTVKFQTGVIGFQQARYRQIEINLRKYGASVYISTISFFLNGFLFARKEYIRIILQYRTISKTNTWPYEGPG